MTHTFGVESLLGLRVDVPVGRSGDWSVERFEVIEGGWGQAFYRNHGRPVPAGEYTRLYHPKHRPMMSDTPAEIKDHLKFIRKAEGRVLISGLGLGWVIKSILLKPEVLSVDVVELEQDVINLVAPTYLINPRVAIHQGDAFTIRWPQGKRWDVAWHDIWPQICSDNLPEMKRLKEKYKRMVEGWQGCWCEDECQRLKARGI